MQFLDAAEELLQTTRLDEITVSLVCERVGVYRSTFYRLFESLAALIRALILDRNDEALEETLPEVGEPLPDFLERGMLALLETWRAHAPVWLTALHLRTLGPEGVALEQQWTAILRAKTPRIAQSARDTHAKLGTHPPANLDHLISNWLEGTYYVLATHFRDSSHDQEAEDRTVRVQTELGIRACGFEPGGISAGERERLALLGAAEQLMQTASSGEITVADICQEAEQSTATFYRYFPGGLDDLYGVVERADRISAPGRTDTADPGRHP